MSSKLCFVCGKRPAVIDGWCSEDWNAKHELINIPEKFEITACSRCNRAKISGRWQTFDAKSFLRSKTKVQGRLDSFEVTELKGKYIVRATGIVDRGVKPKTEDHVITIKFTRFTCPDCSRVAGGYYEAIIQLRGSITESKIKFFEREAAKILSQDSRAFWSAKELKEGWDIKMGSIGAANKLADILRHKYKAEIRKSFQLVGRKDGVDMYRTIISVRFTK